MAAVEEAGLSVPLKNCFHSASSQALAEEEWGQGMDRAMSFVVKHLVRSPRKNNFKL